MSDALSPFERFSAAHRQFCAASHPSAECGRNLIALYEAWCRDFAEPWEVPGLVEALRGRVETRVGEGV